MGERQSVALLKEQLHLNCAYPAIDISPLRGFPDRLLKEACELIAFSYPGVNAWAREKEFFRPAVRKGCPVGLVFQQSWTNNSEPNSTNGLWPARVRAWRRATDPLANRRLRGCGSRRRRGCWMSAADRDGRLGCLLSMHSTVKLSASIFQMR